MKRNRMRYRFAVAAVLLFGAFNQQCTCGDPSGISVNPDCPHGRRAAAALNVQANLAGLRPLDGEKQLQLRGTRSSGDNCFADGAAVSLLTTIKGTSTATFTPALPAQLADGVWTFKVVALSGGDQLSPQQDHNLAAGASTTLALAADGSGTLVMSFP